MKSPVQNRVEEVRKGRGIGVSDLAKRIGVSRPTIYAIEAGTFVPNTEVALKLARELETTVDDLFSIRAATRDAAGTLLAETLSVEAPKKGQAVRVCKIGSRWVSVPVSATPYYMPEADGVVHKGRSAGLSELLVFGEGEASHKRLVLAGCDPATSFLSHMVEKESGVEIVSAAASSRLALRWLQEGKVHIAGSHLEDPKTGDFNVPYLRKEFPGEDFAVVTFARWEEGLVVAPSNPKSIRGVEDLARRGVRFVNREHGSGARALLDKLLAKAGVESERVLGYGRAMHGHLAAAHCVLAGEADVCLATRSSAQAFGLGFVPLHEERYDLVMRRSTAWLPAVRTFLDVLQRATLRKKLEVLAGYDTAQTGTTVA